MLGMRKPISDTQSNYRSQNSSQHYLHPQYVKGVAIIFERLTPRVAGNPIPSTVGGSYAVFEARIVT